jgi:preprotein translocase subunit YajC
MFITPAYAQGFGGGSDMISFIVPLAGMFLIMYFLVMRPQQKRAKEHQAMIRNVRRGDTVVSSGGIVGKVTKVYDAEDQIEVEIAEGVRVRQMRGMVTDVRTKGEPVKDDATAKAG